MFDNLTPEGMLKMPVATIAAAGSAQGDSTPITTGGIIHVTGADATKGVQLPAIDADRVGAILIINNHAAAVLKVYPESGGAINAASANAAISQIASSIGIYVATAAATWKMTNVARV
jgi:hypothetical protein